LGNTLTIGSTKSMGWDELNRMTSFTVSSATTSYTYRADGMRISKSAGSASTAYAYDGQMQVEEDYDNTGTSNDYQMRYGLGARGLEYLAKTTTSGTTVGYPLYDAHGNMLGTIAKSGTNSCTLNDVRSYDAWGGVRTGSSTGDPKPRHCANLGHVQDDESGLLYMRARFFDPTNGRFLSADPERQQNNCYAYVANNPITAGDPSGKFAFADILCAATDLEANLSRNMQNLIAVSGYASYKLVDILTKWAESLEPELQELLYGPMNEFGGIAENASEDRIEITGIDGIVNIAIDFSGHGGSDPHINCYPPMEGYGGHFQEMSNFLTKR
jgi:RHS repeat-associated protein